MPLMHLDTQLQERVYVVDTRLYQAHWVRDHGTASSELHLCPSGTQGRNKSIQILIVENGKCNLVFVGCVPATLLVSVRAVHVAIDITRHISSTHICGGQRKGTRESLAPASPARRAIVGEHNHFNTFQFLRHFYCEKVAVPSDLPYEGVGGCSAALLTAPWTSLERNACLRAGSNQEGMARQRERVTLLMAVV
jgi:hypothetical protein